MLGAGRKLPGASAGAGAGASPGPEGGGLELWPRGGGGGGGPALLWFRPFSEEPEPLQAPFGPLALTVAVAAVATEEEPKPCEGGPWGRRAAVSALT